VQTDGVLNQLYWQDCLTYHIGRLEFGGEMSESDPEITALTTLIKILDPLNDDQRIRVLTYVFHKLNIRMPHSNSGQQQVTSDSELATVLGTDLDGKPPQTVDMRVTATDIRSLKEEKKPRSANEMAALVAFYLEHMASGDERRNFLTAEDIKTYFNQAGFPLPSGPATMTLTNAKNAGYLTARDRGKYCLNPVGYNLIAYKLPANGSEKGNGGTLRKKPTGKKPRRKTGKRK
jgi:hypothetical protein